MATVVYSVRDTWNCMYIELYSLFTVETEIQWHASAPAQGCVGVSYRRAGTTVDSRAYFCDFQRCTYVCVADKSIVYFLLILHEILYSYQLNT